MMAAVWGGVEEGDFPKQAWEVEAEIELMDMYTAVMMSIVIINGTQVEMLAT